jgi:outer membrane protein
MNAFVMPLAALRVLTLADAVHTAEQHQPQVAQYQALTDAARARADEARAPLLPQLTGTGLYRLSTANFVPSPGSTPSNFNASPTSPDVFSYFNFGLTANQLIYDFQTVDKWRAAKVSADAQADSQAATLLQVDLGARSSWFAARAQKALVDVAKETLANQERHLNQTEGFVKAGTHPEIDLAQAKTDRANAKVLLINAQNGYETAKAQLNLAMGIDGPVDYDVADQDPTAAAMVGGEDSSTEQLLLEAVRARPDLMALDRQVQAQELTLRGTKGGYGPSFSASTGVTEALTTHANGWNWNAQLNMNWSIFSGLSTYSAVHEQEANLRALEAQRDAIQQQVRLDVEQARLAVRADKEALIAADEALENARERLRLAEGRYSAGVGNAIELGDAQLALTQAAGQRVSAEFNLATARAQLTRALGRR